MKKGNKGIMVNFIIGIAGGTGSGKTTITRDISRRFGSKVSILYQDNYYKSQDDIPPKDRANKNYDCPDALDIELFNSHLLALKNGDEVLSPKYDYKKHTRSNEKILVPATKVVVTEGILLFCDQDTRNLLDLKLFVDAEPDIRLMRRIRRDIKFRGRSIDSISKQYINTVKPMHDLHVEPSKKFADMIILHGGKNDAAMNMIYSVIDANINNRG